MGVSSLGTLSSPLSKGKNLWGPLELPYEVYLLNLLGVLIVSSFHFLSFHALYFLHLILSAAVELCVAK